MKKILKWFGILLALVVLVVIGGLVYIKNFLPDVGKAPELKVEVTADNVARGKYLANCVMVCMDCHSERDWSKFSGPLKDGTYGAGGERFDQNFGFPGVFFSKNITPTGVGDWTDGELFRAITTGVTKQGEPIFPVMPYNWYSQLDPKDVEAVIAYIRTLKPLDKVNPGHEVDFPLNFILNTIPKPATLAKAPDRSDSVAYGGYLVKASGCIECHTKVDDKNQLIAGTELGGGRVFNLPSGVLTTANLSPDETGLAYWSKEKFIRQFKQYTDSGYVSPTIDFMKEYNTIMPWTMYANMTEADLSSIYQYLRTVKPINNQVLKFQGKSMVTASK